MLSPGATMLDDLLPLPQRLAVNYAPARRRTATAAMLALDARLGELLARASEPLLAQMRLAWWRDELGKPAADRPRGDPVLDAIGASWNGEEDALKGLVDGWEQLVAEPPLDDAALEVFVAARAGAFAALARLAGHGAAADDARAAGRLWALADFAANASDPREHSGAIERARDAAGPVPAMPRALRPLAVLAGLGRRAVARGGGKLVAGRADILVAMRLGMFGR